MYQNTVFINVLCIWVDGLSFFRYYTYMRVIFKTKDGLEAEGTVTPQVVKDGLNIVRTKRFSFRRMWWITDVSYVPAKRAVPPRYVRRAERPDLSNFIKFSADAIPPESVNTKIREYELYSKTLDGLPIYREI